MTKLLVVQLVGALGGQKVQKRSKNLSEGHPARSVSC
eukprot:COSAG02_NODE_69049_length_204_cov_54.790476_1_plen_36_part_10